MLRFISKWFASMVVISMFFAAETAKAQQVTIHGTVYNMYRTRPLDAVSVMSSMGRGTTTDSNGNYMLSVNINDSISFSYLGRTTAKFPVAEINKNASFDIALHVNPTELNEIRIGPKNYRLDSIQNRKEYENVFNYKKPGLAITEPSAGTLGVGLDLDALINMFRFSRNRRMLAFQRRLVEEEHDKFVDHRFNRSIVKKITHLDGDELDSFMVHYRPSYEFTVISSDYEFYDYIKLAYKEYRAVVHKKPGEMKKESGNP